MSLTAWMGFNPEGFKAVCMCLGEGSCYHRCKNSAPGALSRATLAAGVQGKQAGGKNAGGEGGKRRQWG